MKSALRQDMGADLISSEAFCRGFHPSSLGFHRGFATISFFLSPRQIKICAPRKILRSFALDDFSRLSRAERWILGATPSRMTRGFVDSKDSARHSWGKLCRDSIAPLCHSGGNEVTDRISEGTQELLQNDTPCPAQWPIESCATTKLRTVATLT